MNCFYIIREKSKMSETEFVSNVLEAFSKIKGEIDEKGG